MNLISKLIMKIFETGLVPEYLIRVWIRKVCKDAIKEASLGDIESRHAVFRQILKELRLGRLPRNRNIIDDQVAEMDVDFYKNILGENLKHSCCYFATGAEKLDEAEETMVWMTADRAQIRNGMNILEVGCGWGTMTFWLAKQFPDCKITAISQSITRRIYIQKKIRDLGINNITVINSDYDELSFEPRFDRIICTEKFGEIADIPQWDKRISTWLRPKGKLFAQFVVHNQLAYFQENVGLDRLPGAIVNPVRIVPSSEMLLHFQKDFSSEDQWKISGMQYQKTAECWLRNLYNNRLDILPMLEKTYGKRMAWIWFQRWKLYLISLSEQHAFNRGQEWIVVQYLFDLK